MDPLITARYGMLAAERRFEASAARTAAMAVDPAVDYGHEAVEQVSAKHAFSANLAVVRFAQDMWDALLKLQAR